MTYRLIYLTEHGDQELIDPKYLRFLQLAEALEEALIFLRHTAFVDPDRMNYLRNRVELENKIRQIGATLGDEYGPLAVKVCEAAIVNAREAIPNPGPTQAGE